MGSKGYASGWASARTIDDVVDRMDAIDAGLSATDGVAVFNRMYREVTLLVDKAVEEHLFRAGEFLPRLDVHFANLYFEAYAADVAGRAVSPAWAPLFEHRLRAGTHPIQFALAGMNAHISHDLPHAVVATCREAGIIPEDGTPEHADFTAANQVLENASTEIRSWFHTGAVATLDDLGGRVDDALSMWAIHLARACAWELAKLLWTLSDNPPVLYMFNRSHREAVELTSRGILV